MQSEWLGLVVLSLLGLATHGAAPFNRTVCFFEEDACGWTDNSNDNLNWNKQRGSDSGGVSRDHTLGVNKGYYQRINPETTDATSSKDQNALYTSPVFPADERYCVQFWYKLYGSDTRPINLYIQVFGGLGYPVRSLDAGNGVEWTLAEADIDSEYTSVDFRLVIESSSVAWRRYISSNRRYTYYNKDMIAVFDDVYLTNRACRELPICPEGFEVLETESSDMVTCIQFQTNATSWPNAVKDCRFRSPHGHLVSVEDADKERQVIRYINGDIEFRAAAENGVWTSGSDEGTEGSWYWTNTGDPEEFNHTNWRPGQPNNVGSRQHCLSMYYPELGYQWGDEYCELNKPYICQIHVNATQLRHSITIG